VIRGVIAPIGLAHPLRILCPPFLQPLPIAIGANLSTFW
jgi:hypothetical protein